MARSLADMSNSESISPHQKVAVTTHNGADSGWKSLERKFAGLYNPGATCYMNSLLQTLFMTPEFRLKLYSFRYDRHSHGAPENCIPYQLQLLFARLQQTHFNYVETTDLIQSFQWDVADTFVQHDAQEFCRILLDAIEVTVKDHPGISTMVQDLYGGKLMDYLKCCDCGHESSREDSFLDLALTVRSESDNIYNDSLEKALLSYLTPELLTGENQVLCDKCGHKADFMKGFKLKSLPYVLMLQLKRFDLDVMLMQRRKLNDAVTFPYVLNMNVFFRSENQSIPVESPVCSSDDTVGAPPVSYQPLDLESRHFQYSRTLASEAIKQDPDISSLRMDGIALRRLRDRKAVERKSKTERQIAGYLAEGEHVYELFSVMVHSGSSLGGHYYAYIKCFENYRWYDFDDSRVVEIDEEDVEKAYGGESALYGTSAYLLMYRKVHPSNLVSVDSSVIPPEVLSHIDSETRTQDLDQLLILTVTLVAQSQTLSVLKSSTLEDTKRRIAELFHFNPIDTHNIRIWIYNPQYHLYIKPLDGLDNCKMETICSSPEVAHFAMEVKQENEQFVEFNVHEYRLLLLYNRPVELETRPSTSLLSLPKDSLVDDLVLLVRHKTGFSRFSLHRHCHHFQSDLTDPSLRYKSLIQAKVFDGTSLFAINKDSDPPLNRLCIQYTLQEPDSDLCHKQTMVPWTASVASLRLQIAAEVKIPAERLILRKFGRTGGEIKESETVKVGEIAQMGVIYVEVGEFARENQVRMNVDWVEYSEEEDAKWMTFTTLGTLLIEKDEKIATLQGKIAEIVQKQGKVVGFEDICVRERLDERLGRVLPAASAVKDCIYSEKRRFAVQLMPLAVPTSSVVLTFRLFSAHNYSLSVCKDLVFPLDFPTKSLCKALSRLYHLSSSRIEVYRVPSLSTFTRLGLWKVRWVELGEKTGDIRGFPLFVREAGAYIVVKDAMETVREPTEEEVRRHTWKPLPRIVDVSRPKERSVRITVKTDKQQ